MRHITGTFSNAESCNTDVKESGTQLTREAVQIWNGLCRMTIGMRVPIDGGLPIGGVPVING